MKGSIIVICCFALGCLAGCLNMIPTNIVTGGYSFYVLVALMFFVGFSIGEDPNTFKNFRYLNPKLMLLPLVTIAGTLMACAIVGLIWGKRPITDYFAIGSGFGYYSLSSILITQIKGEELGIIALLANITREITTMLGAPLMVRWFGKISPISSGGATSMDATLPIITASSGKEFAVLAIYHGFIIDFSVPFLVTFFCSI